MNRLVVATIRCVMEEEHISVAELARRLQRHEATVHQYLDPAGNMTIKTLNAICEAMQVDLEIEIGGTRVVHKAKTERVI